MTTRFACDYGKRVAGCKKCKLNLEKGELRLAKITPNPFVQKEDGPPPDMKQYYHPHCLFEMFFKARASTKVVESEEDVEDFDALESEDQDKITQLIKELNEVRQKNTGKAPKTAAKKKKADNDEENEIPKKSRKTNVSDDKKKVKPKKEEDLKIHSGEPNEESKYNSFIRFCKLAEVIASVSKPSDKAEAVNTFIRKDGYDGDVHTLIRLLLPGIDSRTYHMKEKQILKVFSEIYALNFEELVDKYRNNGDASIVIRETLEKNKLIPTNNSDWSIQKIDRWLSKLSEFTLTDEQKTHFKFAARRLSGLEIMYLIRLVKKDLRFNAGTKHILEGLNPSAYEAFQNCRDLTDIINRCQTGKLSKSSIEIGIKLGTPVLPMLADACKSVKQAMAKCPNGMYAEIKYDGERVQVHKQGNDFTFYSRSLKPVQSHKVFPFETTIPQAFANGSDLILDAEVLMVDTQTGKPLPFGTLGIHKKEKFKDACPCLFVFDILRYNDQDLTNKPIKERRQLLEKHMIEIPNNVMFSNSFFIEHGDDSKLQTMIWKAIDEGLEGLVLKDVKSKYEPGKRHWLKIKKDYLEEGKMADTADLIVLGAYFGTGSKGGLMSVFLMGVRDGNDKYYTVTKVGNGPNDAELDKINEQLKDKMTRIDRNHNKLPKWLECSRVLVPDFIINDPKDGPVWEITGAEFSKSDNHTAGGISIRFPRLTRIREDKDYLSATTLQELKKLNENSNYKMKVNPDITKEDEIPLYAKNEKPEESNSSETKITTKKRKLTEEEDEVKKTAKKPKEEESETEDECPEGKTPCKYGKKCYRKNADHKNEFWHPKL